MSPLLEFGLCAVVLLAPLPFGAVEGWSRWALEGGALALLVLWLIRGFFRPTALPPRATIVGLGGLLALALVQALPMGTTLLGRVSPRALEMREQVIPSGETLEAERRLLGELPSLGSGPSLSLAPERTASALLTGAALAALFLIATSVVAERGARRLAWAMLLSAAFQGLYGTIVLASGLDRTVGAPGQQHPGATGTFVNKNHFAAFLVLALPIGLVLALRPRAKEEGNRTARWVALLGPEGGRSLFAGLLFLVGLGGLLVSFSRAGIVAGLISLALAFVATRRGEIRKRALVALVLLAIGALPLLEVGVDHLAARFALSGQDLERGRLTVWHDSLEAFRAFPAVGAGFGTFAEVYPFFRSPGVRLRYDHAHQELLQFAAEGGLLGLGLLSLLLVPVLRRALGALGSAGDPVAAGLAAGLIGLLLHALVDFPFRIPAIAASAAILAGTLLGSSWSRGR